MFEEKRNVQVASSSFLYILFNFYLHCISLMDTFDCGVGFSGKF